MLTFFRIKARLGEGEDETFIVSGFTTKNKFIEYLLRDGYKIIKMEEMTWKEIHY